MSVVRPVINNVFSSVCECSNKETHKKLLTVNNDKGQKWLQWVKKAATIWFIF